MILGEFFLMRCNEMMARRRRRRRKTWSYETNGIYSSKSIYALVNFKGVTHVYLNAM
jgi:hypothetical protein